MRRLAPGSVLTPGAGSRTEPVLTFSALSPAPLLSPLISALQSSSPRQPLAHREPQLSFIKTQTRMTVPLPGTRSTRVRSPLPHLAPWTCQEGSLSTGPGVSPAHSLVFPDRKHAGVTPERSARSETRALLGVPGPPKFSQVRGNLWGWTHAPPTAILRARTRPSAWETGKPQSPHTWIWRAKLRRWMRSRAVLGTGHP